MGKQAAAQSDSSPLKLMENQALADRQGTVKSDYRRSKDTSDIKSKPSPLKSCILIPNPDGSGEKLNVKKARSVHFADSLGKPLKSIKTLYDCEDEIEMALLRIRFQNNNISEFRNFFPAENVLVNNLNNAQASRNNNIKSKFVNFEQPIVDDTFVEKVKSCNVLLENVIFREYGVFGTVSVHNIAYEKSVFVDYTMDDWVTVLRSEAKYVPGSNTGATDTFSFEINITDKKIIDKEVEIKFSVCYACRGELHWDSNNGKNYCVIFRKYESNKFTEGSENCNGFIIPKQKFIGWAS